MYFFQELEIAQNQCIGLSLGALKSTPILALQAKSKIPPQAIGRVEAFSEKFCSNTWL